jgi:hypothetical protein
MLLILGACTIAYWVALYNHKRQFLIFVTVLVACFAISLLTKYLPDDYNILYTMYYWQGMFMYINHGNSNLLLPVLDPSLMGLMRVLPIAFEDVFMHPNIFEVHNMFLAADCFFNIWHAILLSIAAWCFIKIRPQQPTILAMCLLIAAGFLSACFYGIIVSNLGALSRYRAVPILLMWVGYAIPISNYLQHQYAFIKVNRWLNALVYPVAPNVK